MAQRIYYCTSCGHADTAFSAYCTACGQPRKLSQPDRAFGVAFLLNELQGSPIQDAVTNERGATLTRYYADELARLTGRGAPRPVAPPDPASGSLVATEPPRPRRAEPPTRKRREPRDWSWLAEQQANLFLFAGAFLTVIAAMIYVAYSGQQVGGMLKMMLLTAYTLAFLAAGVACLRYPRVRTAGQVFFAVGAILVPLNFIVARNILRGEDLSPTSLWLAGSIVTALFYTAVARVGLGRWYSFAGGAAIVSALTAVLVIGDAPPEWTPALYVLLAIAMSLPRIAGDERFRDRVGVAWALEADAIGLVAAAVAAVMAPLAYQHRADVTTLWFLPATFVLFAGYSALQTTTRKREEAGLALLGGIVGLALAIPYALEVPSEFYTVAIAAIAPVLGLGQLALGRDRIRARWPVTFPGALRATAIGATGGAAVVGMLFARTTLDRDPAVIETRWFLLPGFGLILAYYIIDGFAQRREFGLAGAALAVIGIALATVFGVHPSPEYYSFALIVAGAFIILFVRLIVPVTPRRYLRDDVRAYGSGFAQGAVAAGIAVAVTAALSAASIQSNYHPQTQWFLFAAFATSGAVMALCVTMRQPVPGDSDVIGPYMLALTLVGAATSVVYALDVSAEYYSFAFILPAIIFAGATRLRLRGQLDKTLPVAWRDVALHVGRVASITGIAVALGAAFAAAQNHATYRPDSHVFLLLAFAAATAYFALDAMREKRVDISIALLAVMTGAIVSVPYAAHADAPWYGLAFVLAGLLLGFGGRMWTPSWLDERVCDAMAVAAVTAGWLPFEGVYPDAGRIAAVAHLAAAFFYASAALVDRSSLSLNELMEMRLARPIRFAVGWLYVAALTATIGYLYALNDLPGRNDADNLAGIPLLALTVGFLILAVSSRYWRSEFRPHLYAISLMIAIFSLVVPNSSLVLASILTAYVALYLLAAAWEDAPVLLVPAAAFGLLAIPAWRATADGSPWTVVAGYIAIACTASAVAARQRDRRWASAVALVAAAYAVVAPSAGFGMLASMAHHGRIDGVPFERTALYGWSTAAMAVAGLLAIASAIIERRRWIIVPSTLVLCMSLLLGIGHFHPGNVQAYTLVIGVYLLLFGLLALWKFRLLGEIAEIAPHVEAAGAAFIIGPSFVQSFPGVWQYEMVVVIEAALLFIGGVILRRRGLLAASIFFLVAVALRALFDAVNALPNWIVVMLAGMTLLGVGMGILLGRDRWSTWQQQLLAWWDEAASELPPSDAPAH